MAAGNDYGLVWLNQSEMMMPQAASAPHVSPEMLPIDQSHASMNVPYYPMQVPSSYDPGSQQPMELDGFIMMEDLEGEYCGEPPRYMTAATQTVPKLRKKIRPIKHPGLKLQTPIAYKCDTDPSVIPIQKDGMAICEKCGAIGVRHAFYTRHRKYCSLACARGSLTGPEAKEDLKELEDDSFQSQENSNSSFGKYPNGTPVDVKEEVISKEVLPFTMGPVDSLPSYNIGPGLGTFTFPGLSVPDDPVPPIQSMKAKQELSHSYDWTPKLEAPDSKAVPVNCFKHAPMADCWDDITVGMKVEVENKDYEEVYDFPDSFWVATVIRVAGYKALLRYEGFTDGDWDFWVNLCCSTVHPVGWCATRGKPLIPPRSLADKDWKEFLVRRLTGARTLPTNFYSKVHESLKSRFRVGMNLEAVDKARLCQVCVATVKRIVGKRLHITYYDADEDDGFWFHEDSPLLHPVGWAVRVGHEIEAPPEYLYRCESGLIEKDDATEELFTAPFQSATDSASSAASNGFLETMQLEAIDPLNLSAICAATVMKVLKDGYLMIRIDRYSKDSDGSDWFCYHASSPYIFPPGFCRKIGFTLVPPKDYSAETFSWEQLQEETGCILAPESLFNKEIPDHGFEPGMHLECVDLMDPKLVCVATVARVVGRLVKIHFDGWEDDYDQWMDCHSPDLYPVGWCSLVSHKLEPPYCPQRNSTAEKKKPGRRKRNKAKTKVQKKAVNSCPVATEVVQNQDTSDAVTTPAESPAVEETCAEDNCRTLDAEPSTAPEPVCPVPSSSSEVTTNSKCIPRLVDGPGICDGSLNPSEWNADDVVTFLKRNDCGVHADKFREAGTTGPTLLALTNDQIMELIEGKIGPTLKINDLVKQLKLKAAKASMKKCL